MRSVRARPDMKERKSPTNALRSKVSLVMARSRWKAVRKRVRYSSASMVPLPLPSLSVASMSTSATRISAGPAREGTAVAYSSALTRSSPSVSRAAWSSRHQAAKAS